MGQYVDITKENETPRISDTEPSNHQIFQEEEFQVPGIRVIDRYFKCPLDYNGNVSQTIRVFARQCSRIDVPRKELRKQKYLVYLQGGPGFECSATVPSQSGMLSFMMNKGYTVLFLDQRGTGLSSPITAETLSIDKDLDAQVSYCKNFRADSIVRDCELIRRQLGISHWTLLGQSFGGFVILTYLSLAPENLEAVILTGGVAPIALTHPDPVYSRIIRKVVKRNHDLYEKYPQDVGRVKTIVDYLDAAKLTTPNGGSLTSRRFRQLGIDLGQHGGLDRVHNIIKKLYSDLAQFGFLTYKAREMIEHALHFDGNPIYALLHESIYCSSSEPSNWSSERIFSQSPLFQNGSNDDDMIYFYGENIFPWMFEDYQELRPLAKLAERLAQESWTPLYDLERLRHNKVPLAASVYIEDMYVHCDLAIDTLQRVGNTKDLVTNRWLHNALRHAPEELLGYLLNLLQELPSPRSVQ